MHTFVGKERVREQRHVAVMTSEWKTIRRISTVLQCIALPACEHLSRLQFNTLRGYFDLVIDTTIRMDFLLT